MSNKVLINRGCRQGDPVASRLFIICAEILAIQIRNNAMIKGIRLMNKHEIKLSQFADDTTLILDGTEESLSESMLEIQRFGEISGLKINYSKTQVAWIGSMKFSNNKLCPKYNLQWGISKFNLLGIDFDVNLHNIPKLNYDKKLVRLKNIIRVWSRRNLTPIGKKIVFKTLLISLMNHLFISLPDPDVNFMKELKTVMLNFIWGGKVDKIKRSVATLQYSEGGLKFLDLDYYITALKSTWIRRYLISDGKWKNIINCSIDINKLIHCGSGYIQKTCESIDNKFWKDTLLSWKVIADKDVKLNKNYNILHSPIWYNDDIKVDRQQVFIKDWFDKGIIYIGDLLDTNLNFKTQTDIQEKYNITLNFLTYHSLIRAVKSFVKTDKLQDFEQTLYPVYPQNIRLFFKSKKGAKDMYNVLCKNDDIKPTALYKWKEIFMHNNDDELFKIFHLPFRITSMS